MIDLNQKLRISQLAEQPMKVLEVIEPGSEVILAGDIVGSVIMLQIQVNSKIRYLVVWWDNRVRIEAWLESFEVTLATKDCKVQMGFVTN
jgi:hypothetical protein